MIKKWEVRKRLTQPKTKLFTTQKKDGFWAGYKPWIWGLDIRKFRGNQSLKPFYMDNFWNQLESKKISNRQEIEQHLTQKLGEPANELQTNLLFELTKKITAYYLKEAQQSHSTYFLTGSVSEIVEKKFKEGKRRGQTFYSVRLSEPKGEKLRALKENLPLEKWEQITKLAILNQKLDFKYKFWLANKDIIDFCPHGK